MFWNRNHAQEQRQVARPSLRLQLECLEARTLLDASGVAASVGALSRDLGQITSDAVHLQVPAVRQDATKISQDVSNITNQLRNDPVGNVLLDYGAVLSAEVTVARGLGLVTFGLALSAGTEGAGAAAGVPMVAIGAHVAVEGADLYIDAVEKFYVDLVRLSSGGQPEQPSTPAPTPAPKPNAPSDAGTWTATLVPNYTGGNVTPNKSQKVTLTLNADGSGSLKITPFAGGSGLAVSFPAGTALYANDGSGVSVATYGTPNGIDIGFDLSNIGTSTLKGTLFAYNQNTDDYADFESAILNR